MALQPSLRPLIIAGSPNAPHTLDIFLDYVCPYSAKMALAIQNILKPWFDQGGLYEGKAKIVFRLQVQPWHSTSTLTHEAGLAVLRVSPENFWPFSLSLFKNQDDYFDIPTANLTPTQIREKLAQLAADVIPASAVEEFKELLKFKGSANGGTAVTDDLKYNIKFGRQNSIHVSPSFLWDGLAVPEASSGWTEEDWSKFLKTKVTA